MACRVEPDHDPARISGRGVRGWVVYVDADAFVVDLSFNLRSYLDERRQAALVAAPSGHLPPQWWEINNGVFAVNFGHPLGRELIDRWFTKLVSIPEVELHAEQRWGDVADHQRMMHEVIKKIDGFEQALILDRDPAVLNWDGVFIQQVVREWGSFEQRVTRLRARVDEVLSSDTGGPASEHAYVDGRDLSRQANEEFVGAIYRVLLRRVPDAGGFRTCVAALDQGETSFADEMRNCLSCDEFSEKIVDFVNEFLSDISRARLKAVL